MPNAALILTPAHNNTHEIVRRFIEGKPLSPEQTNFLYWHQAQLSHRDFDPVLKYYLQSQRKKSHTSFLLPHEKINREAIKSFKKRLQAMLASNRDQEQAVELNLTPQQWGEFKHYTEQDLIYYHGNPFLTGAPFYSGGHAPIIHFQWGNQMGVVKPSILAEEMDLKANYLIRFEAARGRTLEQFVNDSNRHAAQQFAEQNKRLYHDEKLHLPEHPFIASSETPSVTRSYLIERLHKTPRLEHA